MSKLITRQIDVRIEKINKVLIYSSLLLLISIIKFPQIYVIFSVIFMAYVALGLYELYIYKQNEDFIDLLKVDRQELGHKLIMKYYKAGLLMFICFSLGLLDFYIYNLEITLVLIFGAILVYYGLIDFIILKSDFLISVIKISIMVIAFFILSSGFYYFNLPWRINLYYCAILGVQLVYLVINFNSIYLCKNKIKNIPYVNISLVISLTLILVYELMITSTIRASILNFIFYVVFLWVLLSLDISLKDKFKIKKVQNMKIVNIYFLIILFIMPFIQLIIMPIYNNGHAITFFSLGVEIENSLKILPIAIILTIMYFITIELVNIIFLRYYRLQKGIFKKDIIELLNNIYNNWF